MNGVKTELRLRIITLLSATVLERLCSLSRFILYFLVSRGIAGNQMIISPELAITLRSVRPKYWLHIAFLMWTPTIFSFYVQSTRLSSYSSPLSLCPVVFFFFGMFSPLDFYTYFVEIYPLARNGCILCRAQCNK